MQVVARSLLAAVCTFVVLQASARAQSSTPSGSPIVDFPSLARKSPEEIEKLFGKPFSIFRDPRLEPLCDEMRYYKTGSRLHVCFRRNRAVHFGYFFERKKYFDTPEATLAAVGIDVGGKPPRRVDQTPWDVPAAANILLMGKENDFYWSGSFNGVPWEMLWVGGIESRLGGPSWRKKSWQVKPRYDSVAAFVAEAL